MVDRLEQEERYGRDLNIVKRARFNQTTEPYQTKEVPAKPAVKPHSRVKELPVLPVREPQQDNMLQQHQDNMSQDSEVVSFGQRAQQHQDQQQLQPRQHNIPHNPVDPKQTVGLNKIDFQEELVCTKSASGTLMHPRERNTVTQTRLVFTRARLLFEHVHR